MLTAWLGESLCCRRFLFFMYSFTPTKAKGHSSQRPITLWDFRMPQPLLSSRFLQFHNCVLCCQIFVLSPYALLFCKSKNPLVHQLIINGKMIFLIFFFRVWNLVEAMTGCGFRLRRRTNANWCKPILRVCILYVMQEFLYIRYGVHGLFNNL